MSRVVIVGGSGFIGTKLTEELLAKGWEVTIVGRSAPKIANKKLVFFRIDRTEEISDAEIFNDCTAIINLAGASIGKRWNKEYQQLLYNSRIDTTKSIVAAIAKANSKPNVLINASATGIYGNRGETVLNENDSIGFDFLSHLCVDWEKEANEAQNFGVRTVLIRTGNVLGDGGLLASLSPLFKIGLGGYFGNGKQIMPWIHWKDIVGIYLFAIENNIHGAYNACASEQTSQKQLFKAFAKVIHAPFVWSIPYFAAKLALGNFADALFESQNISSRKIIDSGYHFLFPHLNRALGDIYK